MKKVENLKDAKKAIKNIDVQGAKEIAIFSLKFLKQVAKKHGFSKKFEKTSNELEKTRPTAVVLHNCMKIVKNDKTIESIENLIKMLESVDDDIIRNGLEIFGKKQYTILTHCHSSEAISLIKGINEKSDIDIFVTQTDPLEQGVKTAKELKKFGMHVTLIIDSAVGHFMPEIDAVIVGTDSLRKEGVVNKIGTKLYAIAAKEHGKPFYIAGNTMKLDKRKKFRIEERSKKEVLDELITPSKLKGIEIKNPAFDITPWKYITKVITEKGNYGPDEIKNMLR